LLGFDVNSIVSLDCKKQIAAILAAPEARDRLINNMLQGVFQRDDAYSRLESYLSEFEIGLMRWGGPVVRSYNDTSSV
jgi:predicted nucleotidyltransferase